MIKTSSIPKSPGVYLYKDQYSTIIYVGKAKNLRSRVSSYFKNNNHSVKTQFLVKNIADIEFILVQNEVEALLLENKLIKKHSPKYNISLKDGKTYAYIKLTSEKFPRLLTTRKVTKKGDYFGPYTDGSARKKISHLAMQIFKLRTCRTLPKRACLNYHIDLCSAPCIGEVTKEEYQTQIKEAKEFLKGNTKPVVKKLEKEMKTAAKKLKYEVALEKKQQIDAIKHIHEKQSVDLIKNFDQDVIAIALDNEQNQAAIIVLTITKGVISGKKDFRFEIEEELLEKFIKRYYSTNSIPFEVIVSGAFWQDDQDKKVMEKYLEKLRGAKVHLTVPRQGQKHKLLEIAQKNAKSVIENKILLEIKQKLNLPTLPQTIECFDISNLGHDHVVAGMTQWVNAHPNKAGYRRFKIKTLHGKQDDFAAMREVVYRRYKRLKEEQKEYPDLIIIDGGAGQLNSALDSLQKLSLQIPIIGLAKKEEELYLPNEKNPRRYKKDSEMMLLIRRIRDSVHNFVVSYNRKRRELKLKDEIELYEKGDEY